MVKDFTPTKDTISLHGLGFIQLILNSTHRMHIWHPGLPRRTCYAHSAIHNHRFSFKSRVLKGVQKNVRVNLEFEAENRGATHRLISHNGERSQRGGRESYPVAYCYAHESKVEEYLPGSEYFIDMYEYHHTPSEGVVITVMEKLEIGEIHASSVCHRGKTFDYDFDRFQLSPDELFDFVKEAFLAD